MTFITIWRCTSLRLAPPMRAFTGAPILLAAWRHASAAGYLQHEFGDATLLAPV